jgi:hypothetical protein
MVVVTEPEDMTLRLLREIRADVVETRNDVKDVRQRLVKVEQRIEELHESMTFGLGLAMHANVRHEAVTRRFEQFESRLTRLEESAPPS